MTVVRYGYTRVLKSRVRVCQVLKKVGFGRVISGSGIPGLITTTQQHVLQLSFSFLVQQNGQTLQYPFYFTFLMAIVPLKQNFTPQIFIFALQIRGQKFRDHHQTFEVKKKLIVCFCCFHFSKLRGSLCSRSKFNPKNKYLFVNKTYHIEVGLRGKS